MAETRPLAAALWMLGSVASFTAMAVAARHVQAVHDSFEVLMTRSAVGLVLVLIYAAARGEMGQITTQNLGGHALRNIVHFTGQNLWFIALTLIPLAQVFALEFTSPIWVILLAPLFLGENLSWRRLAAAGLGFLGILIATRPDMSALHPGVLIALSAAVCFACVSILTKRLTRGTPVIGILFWLTFMQFFFGLIAALHDGAVTWPTATTLPWLCLIGLCGVTAHLSLTTALSLAQASYVMPVDFLRLPLIAVIGALAFDEPLDPYVLAGGAVIFAGVWLNLRAKPDDVASDPGKGTRTI
jgi:drug/metabolite transporter (DMT)-like permease